ncbi:DUF5994 family protein [Mycobacterium sp. smrl_JER01]|uniref:DUF5994 family protein n=1 Tax=Mycobacterium sp. smrl_JER01 TaxID=3402633 RepID=UPI003AC66460
MNGIPLARRAAKPIRVTLAKELGTGIDGAWWPHSAAMAMELPDLVGALHAQLGEIVGIRVNWSATEGQLDLETIAHAAHLARPGEHHRRPRLMNVDGRTACAKLLVVPSMTSQALGAMVLRTAARLPTSGGSGDGRLFQTACVVMQLAEAESKSWGELADRV